MAQARVRDAWSRSSSLMALLANLHRPKNKRPFKPADFDPTRQSADVKTIKPKVGVEVLKQVFLKPKEKPPCLPPASSSSPS